MFLADERIRLALRSDLGRRSVSGQHRHIIAERKYFFPDPVEQKIDIAAGKIPTTNTPREKDISADKQLVFGREEAKTSGTMSRDFKHLHFQAEKFSRRRFFDEEVGLDRFNFQFESKAAKEFRIGDHRRGLPMATYRTTKAAFDFGHIRDVIEMAMREQQKVWIDTARFQPGASSIGGVEKNPALRRLDEITICLENPATKALVNHRCHSSRGC